MSNEKIIQRPLISTFEQINQDDIQVKLLRDTRCPEKKRIGDAGFDFYLNEDIKIKPRQQIIIDTGVCIEIPNNYSGLFALRTSICNKHKHLILKNPLIDSNYRGELHTILYNDSFFKTIKFNKGDRVFSLYILQIFKNNIVVVDKLSESNRGDYWNGSSGK